jgi:hypothetical protein
MLTAEALRIVGFIATLDTTTSGLSLSRCFGIAVDTPLLIVLATEALGSMRAIASLDFALADCHSAVDCRI